MAYKHKVPFFLFNFVCPTITEVKLFFLFLQFGCEEGIVLVCMFKDFKKNSRELDKFGGISEEEKIFCRPCIICFLQLFHHSPHTTHHLFGNLKVRSAKLVVYSAVQCSTVRSARCSAVYYNTM